MVALDFGQPENAVWRVIYFTYLKLIVPGLGRIFCGNADGYAYILESLRHYPAARRLLAEMRDQGLANGRIISLLGGGMTIHYAEKPSSGIP